MWILDKHPASLGTLLFKDGEAYVNEKAVLAHVHEVDMDELLAEFIDKKECNELPKISFSQFLQEKCGKTREEKTDKHFVSKNTAYLPFDEDYD